jgi:hypothetical protein
MSYQPTTRVACPNLQARLNDFYNTCNASLLRDPAPFADYLWSDANRSGIQMAIAGGGAKTRTVEVLYDQRLLEAEVTASDLTSQVCAATTKRGNLSTSFSIDPTDGLKAEQKFNTGDWIHACQNNDEVILHEIQKLIDVLYRKNATRITQRAASLLGNWDKVVYTAGNTVTEGSVKYLKIQTKRPTAYTDINPEALEDIDFAIEQSSFCNGAVIFASQTLAKYMRTMQAGCCSSQGIDLSAQLANFGKATVYDRRVEKQNGGAAYAWVLMAGALQPIYYTANMDRSRDALKKLTGQNEFSGANYWKTTIQDPQSGMPMDLTIADNCGDLSVIVRNVVDVKAMPLDMFGTGDDMEGVRFFAGLKVVNS